MNDGAVLSHPLPVCLPQMMQEGIAKTFYPETDRNKRTKPLMLRTVLQK